MNSRGRRKLRRWAERRTKKNELIREPIETPMPWRKVLLVRASYAHFDQITRSFVGTRRERHLFKNLDDIRFSVHGIRHHPVIDRGWAGGWGPGGSSRPSPRETL